MGGRLHHKHPEKRERGILAWLIVFLLSTTLWLLIHLAYPLQVPGPLETLTFLYSEGLQKILSNTFLTLIRCFTGFCIAVVISLALGLVYLGGGFWADVVKRLCILLQSVSVLVWVIILIMLFGVLSPIPPVLVSTLVSFPIMLSSVVSGIDSLDPRYQELAQLLKAPLLRYYVDIVLPSMIGSLVAAARSALGVALRISVVAEAFGCNGGIGYMIENYYSLAEPRGVFAWALLLISLMLILDQIVLAPLERLARRWFRC